MRRTLGLALCAVVSAQSWAQGGKRPDDRIHLERIVAGPALIRDVAGDYAQHPKVFAALLTLRDRLFKPVGACFGIYPDDPDVVEAPSRLKWQVGVRVEPKEAGTKLATPPSPWRVSKLPDVEAAVIETDVKTAGLDGLAMFRWMAEHGYAQIAPTRIEYLSHEGSPMLLPVKIMVPVIKRRSGLILPPG